MISGTCSWYLIYATVEGQRRMRLVEHNFEACLSRMLCALLPRLLHSSDPPPPPPQLLQWIVTSFGGRVEEIDRDFGHRWYYRWGYRWYQPPPTPPPPPRRLTPWRGTLYLRAAVPRRGQRPPNGSGTNRTPSIAFRHPPPNSARFSYATEGTLFISAQLSTDAVSALRKVWVLIRLWKQPNAKART